MGTIMITAVRNEGTLCPSTLDHLYSSHCQMFLNIPSQFAFRFCKAWSTNKTPQADAVSSGEMVLIVLCCYHCKVNKIAL